MEQQLNIDSSSQRVHVRIDAEKNRLYIVLRGRLDLEDVDEGARLLVKANRELQLGYDVINDISELEGIPEETAPALHALMTRLRRESGVRHYVRVVGKAVAAALQFERSSRQAGYSANLAFTLEEAERMLDSGRLDRKGACP